MHITSLVLHPLRIPLARSFKHASAERTCTESLLAVVRDASGREGLGEGCPRSYVTGESLEDACAVHGLNVEAVLKKINEYLAEKKAQ